MRSVVVDEAYDKVGVEEEASAIEGLSVAVVRLPAVHGPGDGQHRLRSYVHAMDAGDESIVLHEAVAGWPWTRGYVEDMGYAVALATDSRAAGRTYHVAYEKSHTARNWVEAIAGVHGWSGEIVVSADADGRVSTRASTSTSTRAASATSSATRSEWTSTRRCGGRSSGSARDARRRPPPEARRACTPRERSTGGSRGRRSSGRAGTAAVDEDARVGSGATPSSSRPRARTRRDHAVRGRGGALSGQVRRRGIDGSRVSFELGLARGAPGAADRSLDLVLIDSAPASRTRCSTGGSSPRSSPSAGECSSTTRTCPPSRCSSTRCACSHAGVRGAAGHRTVVVRKLAEGLPSFDWEGERIGGRLPSAISRRRHALSRRRDTGRSRRASGSGSFASLVAAVACAGAGPASRSAWPIRPVTKASYSRLRDAIARLAAVYCLNARPRRPPLRRAHVGTRFPARTCGRRRPSGSPERFRPRSRDTGSAVSASAGGASRST